MASVVKSLQKLFTKEPKHEEPEKEHHEHRRHHMDEHEILRLKILGGVLKK